VEKTAILDAETANANSLVQGGLYEQRCVWTTESTHFLLTIVDNFLKSPHPEN
jgi:hypothetical protein